jgi:chromosomal replication initiation ATPase DnaA
MSSGERSAGRQLALSLPHRPALDRADFLVGAANRAAVALIDGWPAWPERGALIAGPVGSGKTHLAGIWRGLSRAGLVAATDLTVADAETLIAQGAVAVEDLHGGRLDEQALFHLLNLASERRVAVLVTSRLWPAALPIRLADLVSRLRALRPVELCEPDDDLLRRVLTKLFADRQLAVEAAVVDFIILRMERSLAAAGRIVDRLDSEALERGQAVTRRLAAITVAELFDRQPDFWPEAG